MSMIPRCVVCDSRVANIYAPDARCARCRHGCATCGKDPAFCSHPLADELTAKVAAELRFTMELQEANHAAA